MFCSLFLFLVGSIGYPILELLWRKRTHSSMALAGGISLMLTDLLCRRKRNGCFFILQCMLSACIITVIEFAVGFCVNIIGKRDVWSYATLPRNFMGQICLRFSILWFFLSIPMRLFCGSCRKHFVK